MVFRTGPSVWVLLTCALFLNLPASAKDVPPQAPEASRTLTDQKIQSALKTAYEQAKPIKTGKNADYIPYLAKVPSNLFAISVVTVEGRKFEIGDASHAFPIESIAKPFTLARLLEQKGSRVVEEKIGVNATGQAFNSIIAMESNKALPAGNPLVNPGAIATVSLLAATSPQERWNVISSNLNAFAGQTLPVNEDVYKSETDTNTRNQAITKLLEANEVLGSDPKEALDLYTRECSVSVTTPQLAVMGATLANGGVNPITGKKVTSPETAQKTLALMATNGLYEKSGTWLYKVGVPAKSGVGGGVVAVVPGRFAISAFSPPLDEAGNSVRAQKAIESIVKTLHASPYESAPAMGVGGAGKAGQ